MPAFFASGRVNWRMMSLVNMQPIASIEQAGGCRSASRRCPPCTMSTKRTGNSLYQRMRSRDAYGFFLISIPGALKIVLFRLSQYR